MQKMLNIYLYSIQIMHLYLGIAIFHNATMKAKRNFTKIKEDFGIDFGRSVPTITSMPQLLVQG